MKEKEELIIQSLAVVVDEDVNEDTDRGVAALLLADFVDQAEEGDEMIEELESLFESGEYGEVIKMLDK